VVIKPNFVVHEFGPYVGSHCLTTHGSVIRAVLDYVLLAAGRDAEIAIADAPIQGADFAKIVEQNGIAQIVDFYKQYLGVNIKLIDLRQVRAIIDEESSLIRSVERLSGDPEGYAEIDLADESRLASLDCPETRYVVGDYSMADTNSRHRSGHHEYVVSQTILNADTVIAVPKLKTHSKVGVTVCLKNLIGIIGSKDSLPHHRLGKTIRGGDEFPADYPMTWYLSSRIQQAFQGRVPVPLWRTMRSVARGAFGAGTSMKSGAESNGNGKAYFPSGNWYGNDTIWRTVDDLNRILFFYDRVAADMQDHPVRRYFAVVDGLTSMEGNGPLRGTPRDTGVVLAGDDPLATDMVAATLMGFDWKAIPMLRQIACSSTDHFYSDFHGDVAGIEICSNQAEWNSLESLSMNAEPHASPIGWRNHMESQNVG